MYSARFFALSSTKSITTPAARYIIEAKSARELLSRRESSNPSSPARMRTREEKLIVMMLLISCELMNKYRITRFVLEPGTEARTHLKKLLNKRLLYLLLQL